MSDSRKILVAEDEIHIATAIKAILKKGFPGCVVDHAKNGAEAWDKAKSGAYQIIISDWNMPKKNGDELLADLRKNKVTAVTPFIMLTARGDRDSYSEAIEAGANDYIIKPFKTSDFIARVKGLLDMNGVDLPSADVAEKTPVELVVDRFKNGFVTLPVLPEIVVRLNQLFESGNVSIDELARLVEPDAAIASRLISIANSPLVRGRSDCVSVSRAITRMGLEEARSYIMALANKGMLVTKDKALKGKLEALWWHSLATACCARVLAKKLNGTQPEELFLLGLFHDIGMFLLIGIVDDLSASHPGFDEPTVNEIMQKLHADFGAVLIKSWKYSREFQNVVHFHHAPFNSENVSFELLVIYLASLMMGDVAFGKEADDAADIALSQAAVKLGLTSEMIVSVLEETNESVASVRKIL